jgi:hypothetical protein
MLIYISFSFHFIDLVTTFIFKITSPMNSQDGCFLEPLGGNVTSFIRPSRTAVVGTMNATVMSTPTFHSTTGIVRNIKKLSIIFHHNSACRVGLFTCDKKSCFKIYINLIIFDFIDLDNVHF